MLTIIGQIREKLGKTVNKAMLLRNVGTFEQVADRILEGGGRMTVRETIIKYRVVAQRYFGNREQFWQHDGKAYELRLENECYGRGETHVQFLDYDTGDSLNMTGKILARKEPVSLSQFLSTKHIKDFAAGVKGTNAQLISILIGFMIAAPLFFMIGNYWPQITETLKGVTGNLIALL